MGRVVHNSSATELEIIERGCIVVDKDGVIVSVSREGPPANVTDVHDFGERFIVPGLIDTHAHAPQYAQIGLGTDLPLLEWLHKYTFPTESKFADVGFAQRVYRDVVRKFLDNGTTSCVWFASLHLDATKALCDACIELGQHAYIGKVNMDRNSPEFYIEQSAERSLQDTKALVEYVRSKGSDRVVPIVTPRFVITCSRSLLEGLGSLAKEYDLPVQSHICENKDEIAFTCSLHPENKSYADIYHSCGLLTKRTIMAHAVHMKDEEVDLFVQSGAGISHCPRSNFTLFSGVAPIRKFLQRGVKVGLGTDVSGGFAPSIWDAMRCAIDASAAASFTDPTLVPLTYKEAFYLATIGGAQLMGMEEKLGSFAPGKWFNAQVINPKNGLDLYGETVADLFQKCFYLIDDRNIENVFVKGVEVKKTNK